MKNKSPKRVFVGMSGGVDSSVAAYLLKKQGYDVLGVFIRSYNIDGCAERDAEDARRVAEKLQIPFYVFDFEEEYKKKVVEYMIDGYRKGITPNPDVMCNKEIKFGLFLEKALAMGANYVSTGHYIRLVATPTREAVGAPTKNVGAGHYVKLESRIPSFAKASADAKAFADRSAGRQDIESREKSRNDLNPKSYILYSAHDAQKDQSYFLWTLAQDQLKHCLFPIGDYLKSEVRDIAREAGLPTAEKKDSQGICFLGKVTLEDFLEKYIPSKPGAVLNTAGKEIGEHRGAEFYTIGQRHLNLANRKGQMANSAPVYVTKKDVGENILIVAEGDDNPALYRQEINLENVNFINPDFAKMFHAPCSMIHDSGFMLHVLARVRYRQPFISAKLMFHDSCFMIHFDQPVKFVAPGQSAVFYEYGDPSADSGLRMLGGGVII